MTPSASEKMVAFIQKNARAIDNIEFGQLLFKFAHGALNVAQLTQELHISVSTATIPHGSVVIPRTDTE